MSELCTFLRNGVLTIVLNRPEKRNAISCEMMKMIKETLESSSTNINVNIAVLTGTGDIFSSGNDFSPSDSYTLPERLAIFQSYVATLIEYPKILVAVVNGPAIGMACSTLPLFDIVLSSDDAYFQTPFTQLGLVAEGCSSYTFPRILGVAKAARLLYMNERMSAQEAVLYGLITRVFPRAFLEDEACGYIYELATLPLQSLLLTKSLIRQWDKVVLHHTNEAEVKLLLERFSSEDFFNAITNPRRSRKIKSKL